MVRIMIEKKLCEGSNCGACAYACPTNVFCIEEDDVSIKSPDYCKLCNVCLEICPKAAITIEKRRTIECIGV
ncbi:MAG TPA: 4Fe-4S binding protein [Methanobacterium sp.]|nr:4Fe-4S binding protein [Methanobacterium sp.]